jgi:hypothetical protein
MTIGQKYAAKIGVIYRKDINFNRGEPNIIGFVPQRKLAVQPFLPDIY